MIATEKFEDLIAGKDRVIEMGRKNFEKAETLIKKQGDYIKELEQRLKTHRENYVRKEVHEHEEHTVHCRDCGRDLEVLVEWNDGITCEFLHGDFYCADCAEASRAAGLAEDAADLRRRAEKEDAL